MSFDTTGPGVNLFKKIIGLLNSCKVCYKIVDHKPFDGSSSESSSVITGTTLNQQAKSLIMAIDGKKIIMVVLRGSDKVNKNALKKLIGSGDIRLATPEEVQRRTNTELGTLPCIGSLFNLATYVDKRLLIEKEIAFGTGVRTKTIIISSDDYGKIASPTVGDFVRQ
jgi:Ala-tRNA(Pro) deacylase